MSMNGAYRFPLGYACHSISYVSIPNYPILNIASEFVKIGHVRLSLGGSAGPPRLETHLAS